MFRKTGCELVVNTTSSALRSLSWVFAEGDVVCLLRAGMDIQLVAHARNVPWHMELLVNFGNIVPIACSTGPKVH